MKGFIFTNFLDFLEKAHGLQLIDDMILSCNLPSGGVYSAFINYEFDELVSMLTYVSKRTDTHPDILLEQFGAFVFPYLIGKHSYIIETYSNPLDLLAGIQNHIHIEVKKLYDDADLPTFCVTDRTDNRLSLIYNSSKGLTFFAIGLIKATLVHFNVKGSVLVDDSFDKKKGVKFDIQLLT
jgi:hypothetical protein